MEGTRGILARGSGVVAIAAGLLLGGAAHAAPSYRAETEAARVTAERLLEGAGGRDVWREVRTVRALAVNRSDDLALPYLFEIAVDFREPKSVTRILGQDMDRLRAYLGSSGWGIKEGADGPVTYAYPPERLAQERVLWAGAFSRNLWRIAIGDPGLVVRLGPDGRLELHEADGALTAWIRTDADGHAIRFGFPGDDTGLSLGIYRQYGPRRIPSSGETPEGVRFETLALRTGTEPLDIPANPPADRSTGFDW